MKATPTDTQAAIQVAAQVATPEAPTPTTAAPSPSTLPQSQWRDVCATDDILPDCGSAALIDDRQIAIVRVGEESIYALSNYDPFSEAFVLARGIVGDRGGRLKIASPIFKQSFDLQTGVCLDDPSVAVPIYPVRMRAGRVEIALPPAAKTSGS